MRVAAVAACAALALTLAACATEADREAQAQAQAAALNSQDDAKCQSYGAPPGSPAYIQCRMNLDNQRAAMRQMIAGQVIGNMMHH